MSILFVILAFLGALFGASFAGLSDTQSKARDTERKNDINLIYQQLEQHYNTYSEYPTEKELTLEYDTQLPGASIDALTDPNGGFIQQGDYTYVPSICTAVGCQKYTLSAHLEDGSKYTKDSLN